MMYKNLEQCIYFVPTSFNNSAIELANPLFR